MIETLDLPERVGATHTTGTNLCLNLCDKAGRPIILMGKDGLQDDFWEFPAPSRAKPEKAKPAPASATVSANVVPFPRKG